MRRTSILLLASLLAAAVYNIGVIHGKEEIRLRAQDRVDELQIASVRERDTLGLLQHISDLENALLDLTAKTGELQGRLQERYVQRVTVTAYTPSKQECDADPHITACMQSVRAGTVAVSRDLFEKGWVFGRKVYLMGLGIYEIADLMNKRHTNRIDLFMWNRKDALSFGARETTAALLPVQKPTSHTPVASLK